MFPDYSKKGFTLIELLVVIGVIVLIASIALISIRNARLRADDAEITTVLHDLRNIAEMSYISNDSYEAVCDDGDLSGDGDFGTIRSKIIAKGGAIACQDSIAAYAVSSSLSLGGYWCVDSTGISKKTTDPVTSTVCP